MQNVKYWREALKMGTDELSYLSGISEDKIKSFENGTAMTDHEASLIAPDLQVYADDVKGETFEELPISDEELLTMLDRITTTADFSNQIDRVFKKSKLYDKTRQPSIFDAWSIASIAFVAGLATGRAEK